MKMLKKLIFKFDDEIKSLLLVIFWEIGWYSLLQDECESEIGKEKPGGNTVIVSPLPPPNPHSLNWLCSRKDAQKQRFQPTMNLFFSPRNVCSF